MRIRCVGSLSISVESDPSEPFPVSDPNADKVGCLWIGTAAAVRFVSLSLVF